MDQDTNTIPDNTSNMVIIHLTKEKCLVILAVEGSESRIDELTNSHFQSK